MSRILKFRAWRKGNMTYNHSFNLNIGGEIYFLDETGEWQMDEDKEATIMQFTGLLDKNGKEIYEGDVLAPMSPSVGPMHIIWEEGSFICYNRFGRWGPLYKLTESQFTEIYAIEVIGSIHENPELLKPCQ